MSAAANPAPKTLAEVLDRTWLTNMLATRWPDAEVLDFTVVETLATQATKVRIALDVRGGAEDLPRNICIKGVLTDTGAPASASIIETVFYRDYAAQLNVACPPASTPH